MKKLLLLLVCAILIQCNKSESISDKSTSAMMVEVPEIDKAPPSPKEEVIKLNASVVDIVDESKPKKVDTITKKIIKNGEITIQVGEIKKAQTQVNEIIKKNNAYIQIENFDNNDVRDRLELKIRIPHKNFDAVINSFSNGVGNIVSKNISSDDVTEEYTDVSIKLANKKIYLEKYRNMLKSAATTKDILEIQENIRELEDEIDVSEGRLRFIDDRVNYSTLNLSLYKEKVRSSATSKIGFGSRFGDSITEGWNSFVSFVLGIISFWPFFLLIPLLIFLWRKWKARRIK